MLKRKERANCTNSPKSWHKIRTSALVSEIDIHLPSWKSNNLSFGGRITLIKATLSNLPTYYLSLFKIPKGVAAEIDRIQNHFLWRSQQDYKPHLIKWQVVSKDKEFGGLGLGGIINRNIALLGIWLSRLPLDRICSLGQGDLE